MNSWSATDLRAVVSYFEEALDWEFDVEEFDDRLKMQKLVYFAQECGLTVPYEYNIYRYGPYSPSLAEDYYELPSSDGGEPLTRSLDTEQFETIVSNRDNGWLEIAATIHKIKQNMQTNSSTDIRSEVINRVSNMKEEPTDTVESIYEDLEAAL